jgi:hypothetical protein
MIDFDMDVWIEYLDKCVKHTMTETEGMVYMSCLLNVEGMPEELKKQFLYQVIEKRAAYLGLNPDPAFVGFLALILKSPGESTMFLSALKYKDLMCNADDCAKLFPDGFPTDVEWSVLWDKQKTPAGQNGLDLIDWEQVK